MTGNYYRYLLQIVVLSICNILIRYDGTDCYQGNIIQTDITEVCYRDQFSISVVNE